MTAQATASTPVDRSSIKLNRTLIAIMAAALVLRLLSAFYHGNTVDILPGIHDQVSYHGLAQRVVDGYGFSFGEMHWPITPADAPTAHWSFLYTLFLSGTYWLVGVNPLVVRLIQVVLVSLIHTWLVYRLGKAIFGHKTGLCAAAINSIYIYFVYYAGALMTEPFYIIGILWTLDVAIRAAKQAEWTVDHASELKLSQLSERRLGIGWRLWIELGLAIGFTMLMRQVFGLFVPLLFIWLCWVLSVAARRAKQSGKNGTTPHGAAILGIHIPSVWGMAVASIFALLIIAPWTVRNYQAFGQFVPLNTNSGYAFFWGNHPIYGTNFVGILPPDGPTYQELIPEELRSLNEAELDKALLRKGLGFVASDPTRYVLLSISRTREFFKFWPSPESSLVSNIARVGSFGIMLPFILYGLGLATINAIKAGFLNWSRDGSRNSPMNAQINSTSHIEDAQVWGRGIALLWAFMAFYTLIHLMTWALIRYRLPVDAVSLIFAGYGLMSCYNSTAHYLTVLKDNCKNKHLNI